jgi:hypothetical protein
MQEQAPPLEANAIVEVLDATDFMPTTIACLANKRFHLMSVLALAVVRTAAGDGGVLTGGAVSEQNKRLVREITTTFGTAAALTGSRRSALRISWETIARTPFAKDTRASTPWSKAPGRRVRTITRRFTA